MHHQSSIVHLQSIFREIHHPTHSPLWFISGGGGKITRQLRSSAGASVSIINTFQHFESVILLIARHRRQTKTYNNFRAPVHRQDQSRFRLNLIPQQLNSVQRLQSVSVYYTILPAPLLEIDSSTDEQHSILSSLISTPSFIINLISLPHSLQVTLGGCINYKL